MATTSPTLICFAGAFHQSAYFSPLISLLHDAGFPVESYTMPSVGRGFASLADDVALMASAIDLLLDEGKDVVPIFHSYAGMPGSVVIGGRAKTAREKEGKKGGIVGVVYVGAFLPCEGGSLFALVRSQWPEWLHINEEANLAVPSNRIHQFYHDCANPTVAAAIAASCKGHSLTALTDAVATVGWREYDGRRAFIKCTDDNTVPFMAQSAYIEATGVEWITRDFETSHSPFVSKPAETAAAIAEFVGMFYRA